MADKRDGDSQVNPEASGLGDRVERISCCYASVDQDGRGQHSLAWGMEGNVGMAKGEEK